MIIPTLVDPQMAPPGKHSNTISRSQAAAKGGEPHQALDPFAVDDMALGRQPAAIRREP